MVAGLVTRANQQEMGKHLTPFLDVWIIFNFLSGVILLPILVLTFLLSKRVTKRHPSLINVCMTWILSGIFSLLLYDLDLPKRGVADDSLHGRFLGGRARPTDPEPSKALCIAQTSLLYGILPMWSVAVFILMYFLLSVVNADGRALNVSRGKMTLMLGAPYFVQFCFSLATLVMSLKDPVRVTREHRVLYCALESYHLFNAMAIFTFVVCLGIIMLETQLALLLYRNWRGLRQAGQSTAVDLQLIVRVIVFGVFIFLGMIVDIVSMFSPRSVVPDIYAATAGTVVFLVFGSQADVLRAWCFWKRDGPVHVSPASRGEPGWTNLDLTGDPEKLTNHENQYVAPLPSPNPAQIADHVHGLHGRDGTRPSSNSHSHLSI
ncbi:hypothetical protein GYMLUDRAFT_373458 [Collybiopsis luxurians FD-317 M1]|uniref:Uncharacterized protein n=1 Tax=Collybiopsis luxurians FD-317 M1 TaxID=944289 RepID=A0A0D0APA4_9AGAR|nr:hypothetical protein GYMLUDRAFT_373458 [Collybiopsis luxurians FD-317 M1]